MASLLSRLRRPAVAAAAPLPQNVPTNANTGALTEALRKYVTSLRKIRNTNPYGMSRNNLLNGTKANRNNVNKLLQNYVMNVNKAKYLNKAAQAVIKSPVIPESQAAPVVNAAAQANNKAAESAEKAVAAINTPGPAPPPPPPPPPRPVRPAPPPPVPQNFRQAAAAAGLARLTRLKNNPLNVGKRTSNNKAVYAVNAASNAYYAKKNNSSSNYYRLKTNNAGQLVFNNASPAYVYRNYKFEQKN